MQYWIFDFDGTLVNSEAYFTQAMNYALKPFRIPEIDFSFMEEIRHKHPHRIFEDILSPDQELEAMERLKQYGSEVTKKVKAFPQVESILKSLKKAGKSISIWTGRDKDSTQMILDNNQIASYFDKVISGTCVQTNKPSTDGLKEILQHFSCRPQDMVMVGDHHHDIEPANLFGCISVHARWKENPVQLPLEISPHYQFDCADQFHQWLKSQL